MNNVYIYEGSFLSLINLIYYLFKNNIHPYKIKTPNYNPSLFENVLNLKISERRDLTIDFIKFFKPFNMKLIYYVFLSSNEDKETIIYYYLLYYFKYRDNLAKMRNLKWVREALEINKRVGNEAHKWKGFLRFRELKNKVLYAEVNPDNNIIEILAWHFQKRLKNEYFIIKDVNHHLICLYDKKRIQIIKEDNLKITPLLSAEEDSIEKLWQSFYETIAIKERRNERCRINFMPKKYWPYILEVREEK